VQCQASWGCVLCVEGVISACVLAATFVGQVWHLQHVQLLVGIAVFVCL